VLVTRCESSLLYFNVEHVRAKLLEFLTAREDTVQLVVLFLGTVPTVDLAGAEFLEALHGTLKARHIDFRVAETRGEVRDALRRIGFEKIHGPLESGQTVDVVISAWQSTEGGRGVGV
jgi:MFS superfamily sulfate permease-like transporter